MVDVVTRRPQDFVNLLDVADYNGVDLPILKNDPSKEGLDELYVVKSNPEDIRPPLPIGTFFRVLDKIGGRYKGYPIFNGGGIFPNLSEADELVEQIHAQTHLRLKMHFPVYHLIAPKKRFKDTKFDTPVVQQPEPATESDDDEEDDTHSGESENDKDEDFDEEKEAPIVNTKKRGVSGKKNEKIVVASKKRKTDNDTDDDEDQVNS